MVGPPFQPGNPAGIDVPTIRLPLPSLPPEAWEPLLRFARFVGRPVDRFLRVEAASGIVLLAAATVALVWANSPWAEAYTNFWHTPLGLRIGSFSFDRTLEWFVNDVLMVMFFFVVGMEIRREIHQGELSEWRRAALPAAAAAGGMLVPPALYLLIAGSPDARPGWVAPMATDIALAVGILTLLGKRAPQAMRVFLLAIAILDVGVIAVIASFYSSGVELEGLLITSWWIVAVITMQRLEIRTKFAYVAPAVVASIGIYAANMHPTIVGVVGGLLTPVRAWLGRDGLLGVEKQLQSLRSLSLLRPSRDLVGALRQLHRAHREAMSPADTLIEGLHPWVAFGIIPLFAFANAGVPLAGISFDPESSAVITAVAVGLIFGKPVGILLATWIALRLGIGVLPPGITLRHVAVLGVVAGVGFTMALFIAQLAFSDARLLAAAKVGVLTGSVAAGMFGLFIGRLILQPVETTATANAT